MPTGAPAIPPLSAMWLALWCGIQLGALALAAFRVPLAAAYPSPAEFEAVRVMLAVQMTAAALLFPALCRTASMTIASCAIATLLILASSSLAAWPPGEVLAPAGFVCLWIVALSLWRAALPKPALPVAVSLATLLSAGGALLAYFNADYAGGEPLNPYAFGPLHAALLNPAHPLSSGWIGMGTLAATGLMAAILTLLIKIRSSRRTPAHNGT